MRPHTRHVRARFQPGRSLLEVIAAPPPNLQLNRREINRQAIRSWLPFGFVFLVTAALSVRLFQLADRYAVNVFFFDQWDFNVGTLFEEHSLWEIFLWQHLHRQGVAGVLSKWIEPLFGWNSRSEAFLGWGIMVLSACCFLLLKRKMYGQLSFSDAVIPVIFLNPAQYEI